MVQDETRVITCFLLYQFPGISTPENKYMEIEALVVLWHLILPVISSLWTLP